MKLVELFEDEAKVANVDEVIEAINRDCKSFLQANPGGMMFRGMKGKPNKFYKQLVRQNRRPRNIPYEVHEEVDKWFDNKFGFKARSQAVFVTGEFDDALSYGDPFAIFPIGDFTFAWSPDVGDLFHLVHSIKPHQVAEELDTCGYKSTGLADAIYSGNEIMAGCKEYYAVPLISKTEADWFYKKLTESK